MNDDDTYFELPAPEVFGPQGAYVVALLERAQHITPDEERTLVPARDATWDAARDAAWDDAAGRVARRGVWATTWHATWDATWGTTWAAALDTVCALVVRDLITTNCYDALTRPWRTVIGPIHPDDPDIGRAAR